MIIFFAVLSAIFDWIDFSIFLYFPDLINKIFAGIDSQSMTIAFIAWAGSYLSRGLGALFILPRLYKFKESKTAIIFTGLFVVVPSLIISLLPSYGSIGLLSYFIFLALRFIQGLGIGVDFPISIYYIFEKYNSIFKTSLVFSCGAFGLLLSFSLVLFLKKSNIFSFFYEGQHWRYLFLLISLFGVFSIAFRFIIKKASYNNFLKNYSQIRTFEWPNFFYNLLISYTYGSVFYTFFIYLPFFYKANFNKILTPIFLFSSIMLTLVISFIANKRSNLNTSYNILFSGYSLSGIIFILIILFKINYIYQALFLSIIIAIYASAFVYCMLKRTTIYTFSVSYNFGQGLAACLTPIIGGGLQIIGLNIFYYLLLFTFIGLFALKYLQRGKSIQTVG